MTVEQIARRQHAYQARVIERTSEDVLALWLGMSADLDAAWATIGPRIVQRVTVGQVAAIASADPYLDALSATYGIRDQAAGRFIPSSLTGVASNGMTLSWMLQWPLVTVKTLHRQGYSLAESLKAGSANLSMHTQTQVADAGRAAVQVATIARPWATRYVRVCGSSACSRCIVLAGKTFGWQNDFLRHPGCNCQTVPMAGSRGSSVMTDPREFFDSLPEAEQNRRFTNAGAEAIRSGADISQVVNARSGMTTATFGAQSALVTTTGTGSSRLRPGRLRLMPEEIARQAGGNRAMARDLLVQHGYITGSALSSAA